MARTQLTLCGDLSPQSEAMRVSSKPATTRAVRINGACSANTPGGAPHFSGEAALRRHTHRPGGTPPHRPAPCLILLVLFLLSTACGGLSFADTISENRSSSIENDLPQLDAQAMLPEPSTQAETLFRDLGIGPEGAAILRRIPSEKLQDFLGTYASLSAIRNKAEECYEALLGTKPDPRPLTGLPPLTGDPGFDASQGKAFLTEVEQLRPRVRQTLEFLMKASLNETGLDADAERRLYRIRFERAHWKIVQDAVPRIRTVFASLNIPLPEDLSPRENDAAVRIAALFREEAHLLQHFRGKGEPDATPSELPPLTSMEPASELPVLPPLPEEPRPPTVPASRTVLLERLDSGDPAVPGIPVRFRAALDLREGFSSERVTYRFESSPEVPFTVSEEEPGVAIVLFPEAGTYVLRCIALEQGEDTLHPLGTSEEFLLNVEPLTLSLSSTPEEPRIGQEVTVTAHVSPSIPEAKRAILWETEGIAATGDDEGATFRFRSLKAEDAVVTAHLTAGDLGGTLASASIPLHVHPYDVTVEILGPEEPRARIWDPEEGLVPLREKLAVFEKVRVRAAVSPDCGEELSFSWATNEGSSVVGELHGAETIFSRHTVGACEIFVAVTDREGIELGRGRALFSVTVDEKTLEDAIKRASAIEKLDEGLATWALGDGPKAVALLREARELDPENMAVAAELARVTGEYKDRQRAAALLAEGDALAAEGHLQEALERYESSSLLQTTSETDRKIAALSSRIRERKERVEHAKELLSEGDALLNEERIAPALAKFRESLAASSDARVKERVETLEERLSKARELIAEGVALQKAYSYPEALEKYRESLTVVKDPKIADYAQKLEELLRKEAERRKKAEEETRRAEEQARLLAAKKLREEGAALQRTGKLREAVEKYRESLPLLADPKLEEHIRILEEHLRRIAAKEEAKRKEEERKKEEQRRLDEERRNEAARLVREGVELQKAERYGEALARFRESLTFIRDPRVEEHVTKLEAYVAEMSKRPAPTAGAPSPVPSP